MHVIDKARRYLDRMPPAVSGQNGHNQTFSVACALVHGFNLPSHDARALLLEYNARCSPPWTESEIDHKLRDAERAAHHEKPRGHLIRQTSQRSANHPPAPFVMQQAQPAAPKYELNGKLELPDPLDDGARLLLRTVFAEGEGIRIAPATLNDEEREIPADQGMVLSREEWLKKLNDVNGNPNGIWHSSKKTGIYVTVNPMKRGGAKDADVTAFRHALLEFDTISIDEQWGLIVESRIPCACVISSGGKSIHAWVKIDARDRSEYDERVRILYEHFAAYNPDQKNKNPSRFSRLPNCVRFARRQELLALSMGCESFSEWQAEKQADGIGQVATVDSLLDFVATDDDNSLLGSRWLCRGGSCLLVGPSGVGKSSLAAQLAATWAIGAPAFGITPKKPLKSLIIQAENDTGDLAEMVQGVFGGFDLLSDEQDALFRTNLVFVRDTTHTGREFTEAVRRLIDRHKPDLVWFDPLLSFIGADISRQEVCSQFLRNWLNPISEATGVVWMCVHHTGKPPSDKKARSEWTSSDHAYSGIGSSELVNWARAALVLRPINDRQFELKLAKRGKRAKATHPDGEPTVTIWLKHAEHGIRWLQMDPPQEEPKKVGKVGRPNKVQDLACSNLHEVISKIPAEGLSANKLGELLHEYSKQIGNQVSQKTCRVDVVDALQKSGKIAYSATLKSYVKGPNA